MLISFNNLPNGPLYYSVFNSMQPLFFMYRRRKILVIQIRDRHMMTEFSFLGNLYL